MIGKAILLSTAAASVIWCAAQFAMDSNSISGRVRVIDGDTIEFYQRQHMFATSLSGGMVVRLAGIDAPELRQPCQRTAQDCGLLATVHLMQLIGPQRVTCRLQLISDAYHRRIGECSVPDQNLTLNHAMVADGYAMDYPHFSQRRYQSAQATAAQRERGLWGYGGFQAPWAWRIEHKVDNAVAMRKVQ